MSRIYIDLKGSYVPTSKEVDYMVTEEIRSQYNASQETKILRLYLADPVTNKVSFDTYNSFVEACRAEATQVRSGATLLQAALDYESAEARLAQPVVEPTLDDAGVVINQEAIDADLLQREGAQNTIDSATQEVLDLVQLRNPTPESI
jgi:hypothetical protein